MDFHTNDDLPNLDFFRFGSVIGSQDNHMMAILGGPRSGKTTLLKKLGQMYLQQKFVDVHYFSPLEWERHDPSHHGKQFHYLQSIDQIQLLIQNLNGKRSPHKIVLLLDYPYQLYNQFLTPIIMNGRFLNISIILATQDYNILSQRFQNAFDLFIIPAPDYNHRFNRFLAKHCFGTINPTATEINKFSNLLGKYCRTYGIDRTDDKIKPMTGLIVDFRISGNLDLLGNGAENRLKYFDTDGEEKWAVSVISNWWKQILNFRSAKRSALGDELRFLPGIGVVFQEAKDEFTELGGKID
jgi:uridine kinase